MHNPPTHYNADENESNLDTWRVALLHAICVEQP
jgi:hypothetical protein